MNRRESSGSTRLSRAFVMLTLIGLSLSPAACSIVESGPDDCSGEGILFLDEFSGERDCGWAMYNRGGATTAIENEALKISVSQPGEVWWTNPGKDFDDITMTAEARQISGPDDNAYGLICRYQNPENFYIFLISGDGYYAIGKYQSGSDQIIYLTENQEYVPSDAINQGAATNQIRVSCVGNQLNLTVNGIPLLTVTDPTFVTGDIGVAVSTLQPGTAVVEFDNIRVTAPQ